MVSLESAFDINWENSLNETEKQEHVIISKGALRELLHYYYIGGAEPDDLNEVLYLAYKRGQE